MSHRRQSEASAAFMQFSLESPTTSGVVAGSTASPARSLSAQNDSDSVVSTSRRRSSFLMSQEYFGAGPSSSSTATLSSNMLVAAFSFTKSEIRQQSISHSYTEMSMNQHQRQLNNRLLKTPTKMPQNRVLVPASEDGGGQPVAAAAVLVHADLDNQNMSVSPSSRISSSATVSGMNNMNGTREDTGGLVLSKPTSSLSSVLHQQPSSSPLATMEQKHIYVPDSSVSESSRLLMDVGEDRATVEDHLDHPIALHTSNPSAKHSDMFYARSPVSFIYSVVASLPAVFLGLLLNVLDAMSYGIIVFPASDTHIPQDSTYAGISMFLASTIIAQLVYSFGGSGFRGVNGSMMIEVMPFLHLMCQTIESVMLANGRSNNDKAILATIMLAYALSTIVTGLLFLVIGIFKLGNIVQFFPRHILVGCIGGIGVFLFVTGIEVTTGQKPNMDNALSLFSNTFLLKLWLSALALAIFLKLVHSKIQHHLLVPAFYTFVPLAFYAIAVGICGYSISELRDMGWLFDLPSSSSSVSSSSSSSPLSSTLPPFYTFWTYFDFSLIDASALAACIPTILALSFFGILHVPINVPALAVSSKQDVDINHEIVGHGVSNIIAGLLGTCQNYLVYTNSVLFMRSGGDSRIAGVLLAIATSVVWIFGESFIGLIPTVAVGALIFHLSIDLVKESVIDTWNVGILPLEYATIIVIIVVMTIVGFTEGIIVGIILACLFFVVMYSRKSIIRSTASGKECRSTVHRLYRQQKFLDDVGSQILIIKLQGFMFFGTINQLDQYIRDIIKQRSLVQNSIKYIIFDFSLINGMDYSATESFVKLKKLVTETSIYLIFCGVSPNAIELIRKAGIMEEEKGDDDYFDEEVAPLLPSPQRHRWLLTFEKLDEALEWCENSLLAVYFEKIKRIARMRSSEYTANDPMMISDLTTAVDIPSRSDSASESTHDHSHSMATFESLSQFTPRERETRLAVNTALKPRGKGLAGIGASREHIDNQDSDDQVGGPMSMILGALHCTLSNPSSGSHNVNAPIENALMYQTTCSSPFIGTSAIQESTEPDPFSESNAEMLSSFFVWKSFGRGSIIWEADQKPDWLFIVEEGELELSIQDGGRLRVVETLICGTMVGELEIFSSRSRPHRLRASEDSILWGMSMVSFQKMCSNSPALAIKFIRLATTFDSVRLYQTLTHFHATE